MQMQETKLEGIDRDRKDLNLKLDINLNLDLDLNLKKTSIGKQELFNSIITMKSKINNQYLQWV